MQMDNRKPVLVIMAAGMGSRYGGMKQIEAVDEKGHIIMDYSISDALLAGFEEVVFIIKEENEKIFREVVGERISKKMRVSYAFQKLENLPDGFDVPEGRVKPWGTAHAVLSAKQYLNGPFAVINADDYYGPEAFRLIYDYLTNHKDDEKYRYAMVGYVLENTVTDSGYVARGVCQVDSESFLSDIVERTRIIKTQDGTAFSEDDGQTWTSIDPKSLVSMNMWGFSGSFVKELDNRFAAFLRDHLPVNPLKCEYFLPFVVDALLKEGKATVQVLPTPDKWYGMTYKEDRDMVVQALADLRRGGQYPELN